MEKNDGKDAKNDNNNNDDIMDLSNVKKEHNPTVVTARGYKVGKKIGIGGFSSVYEAASIRDTNKRLAVKIMKFETLNQDWKDSKLMDEMKISKRIKHENVIKVYDVIKTTHRAFLFMERARCSLDDYIRDKHGGKLSEKVAKVFFKQAVNGVMYLHSKGVAHRGNYSD